MVICIHTHTLLSLANSSEAITQLVCQMIETNTL